MKNKVLFPIFCFIVSTVLIIGCKKEPNDSPQGFTNPAPMYKVGQGYGGGAVFYVDESGMHGLVVDTSNSVPKKSWSGGDSFVATNATATELGMGASNCQTIVASVGEGNYAAYACEQLILNGYSDWFLPSKAELYFIYTQKTKGLINHLNQDFYWTSSETSQDGAWSQSFVNGSCSSTNKAGSYAVCAVRSF